MKSITSFILVLGFLFFSGCSGCSKSGIRNSSIKNNKKATSHSSSSQSYSGDKITVKMVKVNGVYEVPITVNDIPMTFIFDTGASSLCISSTEANFLYKQGKLTDADITGQENFMDATGSISVGTKIILKTVKIGSKTIENVEATVISNANAPLLLGQTVLSKFGKVSIDYNKNTLTLEE